MTKEEQLKKEAKKWLRKFLLCNDCKRKCHCIELNAYCEEQVLKAYIDSAKPREKQIDILSQHILELQADKGNLTDRVKELEVQIEKMKKYAKLLQDICVVLGNDNFMVSVQLESVVKKLWDKSEEENGFKMVDDILNRLLEIRPQDWAEIGKWEIKEK